VLYKNQIPFSYILALAAAVKSPSNYRHRLAKDIEN